MEIPKDISRKPTVLIVSGLVLVFFFGYRAHVNSRQALQILDLQVPNITRVAFDTQVFALTPANLEPVLTSVAPRGPALRRARGKGTSKDLGRNLILTCGLPC